MISVEQAINTNRYPIFDLESGDTQHLVRQVQESLADIGACVLPDFVTPEALSILAAEANELKSLAFQGPTSATPYFFNYQHDGHLDVDGEHPLKRVGRRCLSQVASDLIPEASLLHRIYYHDVLPGFLAAVRGTPIFHNCDPYQNLNISVMQPGGCQQWHFDGGTMVTTLLLQEPEAGGVFEFAPNIRSDDNENYEDVRKVLDGETAHLHRIEPKAGQLVLFQGHYSLHRVTEVAGERARLQAILGYTHVKNYVGTLESSVLHYGERIREGAKAVYH